MNDACVLAGKPLVSGSALRFEGQLTVYNYKNEGPTYRSVLTVSISIQNLFKGPLFQVSVSDPSTARDRD